MRLKILLLALVSGVYAMEHTEERLTNYIYGQKRNFVEEYETFLPNKQVLRAISFVDQKGAKHVEVYRISVVGGEMYTVAEDEKYFYQLQQLFNQADTDS